MADGARDALGGYLYQFLGGAGLAACAHSLDAKQAPDRQVVAVASRARAVIHEEKDMDVVVHLDAKQNAAGVQFKYSRGAPPRPIEANELIEILDAFDRSVKKSSGLKFTEFVLISNRPFAPSAVRLYATRNDDTPDAALFPKPATRGKRVLTGRQIAPNGETRQIAAARHNILAKLSTDLDVRQETWIENVKTYASRHGVLPPEFERALDTLVGRILRQTVENPLEITSGLLNECLIGAADARSLAIDAGPESARAAASEAVREFVATTLVDDGERLIRRELIEEVEKQVATHSLVFVVGDGGSGKSVLVAQYLQNEADRRFAAVAHAREIEDNWAGRLVTVWRSPSRPSNFGNEGLAEAVGRLRHANPDASRPILVLDLDGIDEASREQRPSVQRLLQQFWRARRSESADAVLLVTSRGAGGTSEAAMDRLVRGWITSDIYSGVSANVGRVFVRDFGEEELSRAARVLGEDCWRRIAPALASSAHGGIGPTALGDEALLSGASPAAVPAMVNSLRHPAMWGSFVSLDHEWRLLVLEEHSAALSELAKRFLVRFCDKVNRRHVSLSDRRVLNALRSICTAIPGGSVELSRHDHWILPARGPVTNDEAACLFDEAISYGLIVEDARGQWLWRHGFVPDHLKGD